MKFISLRERSETEVKTAGDDLALDFREPDLHLVEPGGVGRSEVEMDLHLPDRGSFARILLSSQSGIRGVIGTHIVFVGIAWRALRGT
jgi:hypothetical protein